MTLVMFLGLFSVKASETRPAAVAGKFYPAEKQKLTAEIEGLLNKAPQEPDSPSKNYGFLVPHAGYKYSGQTAAYAFNILKYPS